MTVSMNVSTVPDHGVAMPSPNPDLCDEDEAGVVDSHDLSVNKHAGLLLLALKEKHRLTQTSVDFAVQQVKSMMEYALEDVKAMVETKLEHHCAQLGVHCLMSQIVSLVSILLQGLNQNICRLSFIRKIST